MTIGRKDETLRYGEFRDNRQRLFDVVKHEHGSLTVQEQDTGVYWHFEPPMSLAFLMADLMRERKMRSAVGLVISGHMPSGPATMRWVVK